MTYPLLRHLHGALAAALITLTGATALAQAQQAPSSPIAIERDGDGRTLQELYQAALKEGGQLTIYAGGDEVTQGFGIKAGFEHQFPGMKLNPLWI